MSFDDRLEWLLVGCVIGFILGYIVRSLREIKEELDEVEKDMKTNRARDDRGFVRNAIVLDVCLVMVIALTVWASFSSQLASNGVKETQQRIARVSYCNQEFQKKTLTALNERTEYTQSQTEQNIALQKAQAAFVSVLLKKPPATEVKRVEALNTYFNALSSFVVVNERAKQKVKNNPFPTTDEFADCLSK